MARRLCSAQADKAKSLRSSLFLPIALTLAVAAHDPVWAQVGTQPQPPNPPKPTQHANKADGPEACVGSSAIYWAGSGPRVHVVRRGAVSEQKPLEPESGTRESVVLEVLINAKTATALGASFDEMRRGGPPKQLEEETGSPIRWSSDLAGLPLTLNLIAEDGPQVVARLRFEGCGSRLANPPERSRPARKPDPSSVPKRDSAPTALPQGAIE
jgi:hypothetical protein